MAASTVKKEITIFIFVILPLLSFAQDERVIKMTTPRKLLVAENPAYIRRDLPKYIPQLFVLSFEGAAWSTKLKNDPLKTVTKNFPIERLQAMIDK